MVTPGKCGYAGTMENNGTPPKKSGFPLWLAGIPALAAVAGLVWLMASHGAEILAIIASKEAVGHWLESWGPLAPLAYMGLQILQIVIFVIPGEVVQIAAGYFFGVGPGFLYAIAGAAAGTVICYGAARVLGMAFVTRLFGEDKTRSFEGFLSTPRAMVAFFLLFLIPGIPKDMLCYVGGLSRVRLPVFLGLSLLGRTPALLASIVAGDAAASGNWPLVVGIGIAAALAVTLGIAFRKRLHPWVEKLVHGKAASNDPGSGTDDPR